MGFHVRFELRGESRCPCSRGETAVLPFPRAADAPRHDHKPRAAPVALVFVMLYADLHGDIVPYGQQLGNKQNDAAQRGGTRRSKKRGRQKSP